MTVLKYGETAGRKVSERIAAPFASRTTMALIDGANAADGQVGLDLATGALFKFSAACVLAADANLVLGAGVGRWLALPNQVIDISMPITFNTADLATLYTLPAGSALIPVRGYWEVATGFTGGASSAIGLASSKAPFTTAGDLLGGATGDVAATLVTGAFIPGTIGTDLVGATEGIGNILVAADIIRFNRITSAFAAGAGNAHLLALLVRNVGA